jgi:hypothetical protein
MNKRRMYTIGLTALLLGVMLTTYGVWTQSNFSHGEPSYDEGCYCHNSGIAVWINGTGDGDGGISSGSVKAGSTFHLLVSTNDEHATGVVPGLQQWESNQTDNAKFMFSPTQVTDNSAADLNKTAGNIMAFYAITAPTTNGDYVLTLYAQGTLLQPIAIQVSGGSTTSTTTSTTTTSTTSTTHSSSTSTTSASSTKSSTSSSTTSASTSPSSTSTTSTPATTTTPTTVGMSYTSPSLGESLVGNQAYTISGTIYPIPALPDNVSIEVQLLGSSTVLDSSIRAVTASGNFSYTTHVGEPHGWTSGPYLITVTDSNGLKATTTFEYEASATTTTTNSTTAPTTVTQTVTTAITLPATTTTTSTTTKTATGPGTTSTVTDTQTVTGSTTTVTEPASTITSTATTTAPPTTRTSTQTPTQTATSTVTQTTSTTPGWAYAAMIVLLLIGLAIGYVVKRPSVRQG